MRVVAGTLRGKHLVAPRGNVTRPTADRVRQATFNALESRGAIDGARVLDLFAGTGAMAIEAISRGASTAVCVDDSRGAIDSTQDNVKACGLSDRVRVVRSDVLKFATAPGGLPISDLVIVDPPYPFDGWEELVAAIYTSIAPGGWLVAESDRQLDLGEQWTFDRVQRYGGTVVMFATRAEDSEADPESAVIED